MCSKQANAFIKCLRYQQGHHASRQGQRYQTKCQPRVKGENTEDEPWYRNGWWAAEKGKKVTEKEEGAEDGSSQAKSSSVPSVSREHTSGLQMRAVKARRTLLLRSPGMPAA